MWGVICVKFMHAQLTIMLTSGLPMYYYNVQEGLEPRLAIVHATIMQGCQHCGLIQNPVFSCAAEWG